MRTALKNLLVAVLGLRPSESLAFIHDEAFRMLEPSLRKVGDEIGVRLVATEIPYDGIRALEPQVSDILLGEEHQAILFGLVHNIWHTPERKKAKYELKKRLASIVCSPDDLGHGAALVEVTQLSLLTREVAKLFISGAQFQVSTPAGTNLTASIGTPFCEDGRYDQPGTGGDFPAGEVGFGPQLGSVTERSCTTSSCSTSAF